jgi:hypothetical protein
MQINHLTPQGFTLTEKEISDWRKKSLEYSLAFNSTQKKADFDLSLLKRLKIEGSYELYITPMWKEHLDQIEELIVKKDIAILDNSLVRYAIYLTIVSVWANKQIPYLEKRYSPDKLERLLKESVTLYQTIINTKYKTSESRVNHLTHLSCFEDHTDINISDMTTVVEFGGGYGGMTALLKAFNENMTIVVIDFPVMITLQSFYISGTLGKDSFCILTDGNLIIQTGKINYLPVTLVEKVQNLNANLFIATWSLTEANKHTQDTIESMNFFNADHILLGYRFYLEKNPNQLFSEPTPKMLGYSIKFHGPTFWSLNSEQYYLFASY